MLNPTNYFSKLNSWWIKFKRYTVTYKNGFYHLSNLANSPYTMVESFDKMPFCDHDRERKKLTADTLFLKVELLYTKLEDGIWIFVSDLHYKKDQVMNNLYDKSLPMDYHFINLHYRENKFESKSMLINGLVLADRTWSVFKSGNALTDYHFKNSHEKNITIYFTEKWLNSFFSKYQISNNNKFMQFMNSSNEYILIADEGNKNNYYFDAFYEILQNQQALKLNHNNLLQLVKLFLYSFEDLLQNENISEEHFKLSDKDRKYIQQAEKIIFDNLNREFPGIEKMAKIIGVSETKLKANFKTVHNKTIYEYYSNHQMKLAYNLISKNRLQIKDVAKFLGYDNASKFSARFKEQFGVLPSEIV